jgi:hypothetical protein
VVVEPLPELPLAGPVVGPGEAPPVEPLPIAPLAPEAPVEELSVVEPGVDPGMRPVSPDPAETAPLVLDAFAPLPEALVAEPSEPIVLQALSVSPMSAVAQTPAVIFR